MQAQTVTLKKSKLLLLTECFDILASILFFIGLSKAREMRFVVSGIFLAVAIMNFALGYTFKKKAEQSSRAKLDTGEPVP